MKRSPITPADRDLLLALILFCLAIMIPVALSWPK